MFNFKCFITNYLIKKYSILLLLSLICSIVVSFSPNTIYAESYSFIIVGCSNSDSQMGFLYDASFPHGDDLEKFSEYDCDVQEDGSGYVVKMDRKRLKSGDITGFFGRFEMEGKKGIQIKEGRNRKFEIYLNDEDDFTKGFVIKEFILDRSKVVNPKKEEFYVPPWHIACYQGQLYKKE